MSSELREAIDIAYDLCATVDALVCLSDDDDRRARNAKSGLIGMSEKMADDLLQRLERVDSKQKSETT